MLAEVRISQAYEKYADLYERQCFDLGGEAAKLAILYSTHEHREGQLEEFVKEAHAIAQNSLERGIPTDVIECTNVDPLFDVIKDPSAQSMIVIGNGSFGQFWVPRRYGNRPAKIDWARAAKETTHLKTGIFQHRACGHYASRSANLPFAMFLVSDFSKIYSPIGKNMKDRAQPQWIPPRIFKNSDLPLEEVYRVATQRFVSNTKGRG